MSALYLLLSRLQSTRELNGFLYFLRKLPLLRRCFEGKDYRYPRMKKLFWRFNLFYSVVKSFLSSLFLAFLAFGISLWLAKNLGFAAEPSLIASVFLLFYFIDPLSGCHSLSLLQSDFTALRSFRINPRLYLLTRLLWKGGIKALMRSLVFLLIFPLLLAQSPTAALVSGLLVFTLSLSCESLFLVYFKQRRRPLKPLWVALFSMLIFPATVFFALIQRRVDLLWLTQSWMLLPCAAVLGLSLYYLRRYPCFDEVAIHSLAVLDKLQEAKGNPTIRQSLALRESDRGSDQAFDLLPAGSRDTAQKRRRAACARLNRLFFARHRRLLFKPVLITCALLLGLALIQLAYIAFPGLPLASSVSHALVQLSPYWAVFLPFTLYLLCNRESISSAFYYNCDEGLLSYPFYRENHLLLLMFRLRLSSLMLINALPAALLALNLIIAALRDAPLLRQLPFLLLEIFLLAVLFSVHILFRYYFFQPYRRDKESKNYAAVLLNTVLYLFCWIIFVLKPEAPRLLPLLLLGLAAYIALALFLTYKYAGQRFAARA